VQRILVKRLTLSDAGFDTGAAAHHRIRKNYRNSRQILRAASRLANHYGKMAGAQGEEIEVLDPELAQRETNPPIALKTDDQVVKAWEIVLECATDQEAEPWTACIVTGDLKGFEFRLVLILGCDASDFPHQGTPRDEVWRDALRLYVAMTRGRDQVFLLHSQEPSSFISVMGDTLVMREEPVLKKYPLAMPTAGRPVVNTAGVSNSALSGGRASIDMEKNCEDWFAEDALDVLRRYFARHVYRDGLTFRGWFVPRALATIARSRFRSVPKCPGPAVERLFRTLEGV
jgi:hypothetical protein